MRHLREEIRLRLTLLIRLLQFLFHRGSDLIVLRIITEHDKITCTVLIQLKRYHPMSLSFLACFRFLRPSLIRSDPPVIELQLKFLFPIPVSQLFRHIPSRLRADHTF